MSTKNIYKSSKLFFMLLLLGSSYSVHASKMNIKFQTIDGKKIKTVSVERTKINNLKNLKELVPIDALGFSNKTSDYIKLIYKKKKEGMIDITKLPDNPTIHVVFEQPRLIKSDNDFSNNDDDFSNNDDDSSNNDDDSSNEDKELNKNDITTTDDSADDPNKDNNDETFWSRNKWYIILGGGGFVTLVAGVTMVVYSKKQEEEK